MSNKLQRCNELSDFATIEETEAQRLADLYKMFADASRAKILYLLQGREICVNHIADALNMSKSAVSHQLRLLRSAGLVRFIKEGKNSFYALDDTHVSDILKVALDHIDHK
jgi:ArsR family transcriptional regulator, lead/cadmium/zinc/bismuth-responsive transcriptional repressor